MIPMAHFTPVSPRHTIAELRMAMKKSRDEGQKTRIRAILAAKVGSSRNDIVALLSVSDHSVTNWVHAYNEGGLDALKTKVGGRPKGSTVWKDDLFTDLAKEIDKGGYWSIPRMQAWLQEHKGKDIPEQTVWYRMDQLNYSYKGARPHPMQGNKDKQEAFKKGALLHSWSR
jgi:transposase